MNRKQLFFGIGLTGLCLLSLGCKSTWSMKNPFTPKPAPEIASPSEMDQIQLKTPPEDYTKGKSPRSEQENNSLAQNGDYRSPRAGSALEVPTQNTVTQATPSQISSAQAAQTQAAQTQAAPFQDVQTQVSPAQVAMNPASFGTNPSQPFAQSAEPYPASNGLTTNDSAAAPGFNNAYPTTSGAGTTVYGSDSSNGASVFAPGSIGGY